MRLLELWRFIFRNTKDLHLLKWLEEQTRSQRYRSVVLVHRPATRRLLSYHLRCSTRLALTLARSAARNPTLRSFIAGASRKRDGGGSACRAMVSPRVTARLDTQTSHLRKANEDQVMTMPLRVRKKPEGFSAGAEARARWALGSKSLNSRNRMVK
jgi:hypothetical protein